MAFTKTAKNLLSQVAADPVYDSRDGEDPKLMSVLFSTAGGAATLGTLGGMIGGPKMVRPAALGGAALGLVGSTALKDTRVPVQAAGERFQDGLARLKKDTLDTAQSSNSV